MNRFWWFILVLGFQIYPTTPERKHTIGLPSLLPLRSFMSVIFEPIYGVQNPSALRWEVHNIVYAETTFLVCVDAVALRRRLSYDISTTRHHMQCAHACIIWELQKLLLASKINWLILVVEPCYPLAVARNGVARTGTTLSQNIVVK